LNMTKKADLLRAHASVVTVALGLHALLVAQTPKEPETARPPNKLLTL
jgi:hypothetical protein